MERFYFCAYQGSRPVAAVKVPARDFILFAFWQIYGVDIFRDDVRCYSESEVTLLVKHLAGLPKTFNDATREKVKAWRKRCLCFQRDSFANGDDFEATYPQVAVPFLRAMVEIWEIAVGEFDYHGEVEKKESLSAEIQKMNGWIAGLVAKGFPEIPPVGFWKVEKTPFFTPWEWEEMENDEKEWGSMEESSAVATMQAGGDFQANDQCLDDVKRRRLAMAREGLSWIQINQWEVEHFADRLTRDNLLRVNGRDVSTRPDAIRKMVREMEKKI